MSDLIITVRKFIEQVKEHPKFDTIKETGSKKSIQYGFIALAALGSQLLKTLNQDLFDFVITFIFFVFLALLIGSSVYQDRRDSKLRQDVNNEYEKKYQDKISEWQIVCNECSASNESLIFELKALFDKKLSITKENYEKIIGEYRMEIKNAVDLFIEEKRKRMLLLCLMFDNPTFTALKKKVEGDLNEW